MPNKNTTPLRSFFGWKVGLILTVLLIQPFFMDTSSARNIRPFPSPLMEFEIKGTAHLRVELPVSEVFNFQIANGRTLISGTNFTMIAEQQAIDVTFKENLIVFEMVLPQDKMLVQQGDAFVVTDASPSSIRQIRVTVTDVGGRPVDKTIVLNNRVFIQQDQDAIKSLKVNGVRLTGQFGAVVVDDATGKTSKLLESAFPQKGTLVLKALPPASSFWSQD